MWDKPNGSTTRQNLANGGLLEKRAPAGVRIALRKPDVLAATGWSNSTLYTKMAEGKFPRPTRLDPEGRVVVWFLDQVQEFQRAAVEREAQKQEPANAA